MAPADLRLRLLAAFIAIACLSQLHSLAVAGVLLALVLPLAWFLGPLAFPWRRLWHLEGFLLLLFATLPFTMDGRPLFTLGPLVASLDGVWRASLIAAKVSTCVLVLTVLLGDVEPARLGVALRGLRVPERLSRLCVMTMRYTSLLRDEARRLHDAMRARGFRPRSSRHTWRSYGNLIGMLLVRALDRAERVEEAMLCRGYTGSFPYHAPPFPPLRDWIGFGAISAAGVAILVIDRL
ncbi:cobalt ECF transporter T component CbiQ [Ancylobacter amanitiformis]|uniref:Cobalt/nickel transport system permease protein n=1 Tax=Ancylobacter amanitiformis TaxID=217069 RepID=A0ABU0LMH8_9HYPH|nr:cobalt ECF transporter T component CbiQ [Ancylobacter amanitiformis]MDQ0509907.1 cobalt/nickel transport system permease protein [Ancylobacter amanitiformis]